MELLSYTLRWFKRNRKERQGVIDVAHPEASNSEISVKLAGHQLKFLKNRAKELGISEEEVIRWYIVSDMARAIDAARDRETQENGQFSLMGIIRDCRITDKDIEEVIGEWNKPELP